MSSKQVSINPDQPRQRSYSLWNVKRNALWSRLGVQWALKGHAFASDVVPSPTGRAGRQTSRLVVDDQVDAPYLPAQEAYGCVVLFRSAGRGKQTGLTANCNKSPSG